jgi:DNA-binding Lrp family transcriptional regulator
MDSRISFSEIAKDCEVSTNTIRIRFERLKKSGIITGSTMHVKPKSFGYEGITLLAIEADVDEEQSVLEFLEKIPNIILSHLQIGKHNIVSMLIIKNLDELVHTLDLVKSNPHIRMADTAISANVSSIYHPENLVIEPFDGSQHTNERLLKDETHKLKTNVPPLGLQLAEENHFNPSLKLDKTDLSIISILSKDARVSFRKIAKNLGISTRTVIKRFQRLKKDVIYHSTITLNLKKLGYVCNAILCINVSGQHNTTDVVEEIVRIPNVIMATKCVGGD